MKFLTLAIRFGLFTSIITTILALGKIHAKYFGKYDLTASKRLSWIVVYSIICYISAYFFGLPDQRSWSTRIKASLAAATTSTALISFFQVFSGQINIPRFVLALSLPSLFIVFNLVSVISLTLSRSTALNEQILLISSFEDAQIINKDIAFHCEIPCVISHHLTIDSARKIDDFPRIILENQITLVVLGNDAMSDSNIVSAVASAHSKGARIRTQIAFYNNWIGKVPVRELSQTALLFDIREIHHVGYSRISRLLDIFISFLGLFVLILFIPIVFIGNLIGNRGPLLYAQERIGKSQYIFRIYKFISMIPGSSVGEWTKKNDSRVTGFGKFLRLSHVDELPQVVNILRGDLSIVGPRPEQPHYVNQLAESIPYYRSRHLVRPGLTGWAQINYPYGADEIDAFEKLQYEFWYLQHQSMWLDFRIIARTFRHVLGFKGR